MAPKLAIVMAAGKGTRMKSELPKVLFRVAGRPMVQYVLDALAAGGVEQSLVVVGYRAELVRAELDGCPGVRFVPQTEQLGTGHAVMCCREYLAGHDGPVVVVAGDSPLMQARSIRALLEDYERRPAACILGTAYRGDPAGLGRVIRDERGEFVAIVEERDATEAQRRVTEVNMSYYLFDSRELLAALDQLRAENAQREYYITDCPGILARQGKAVRALPVLEPYEALGVNTLDELAAVERKMVELGLAPPA